MSIFDDFLIFIILVAMFLAVWIYGHKGIWGKAASKFSDDKNLDYISLSEKGFDMGFIKKEKWEGGFYSHLSYSNSGIYFISPIIIRLFLPSIYIPWDKIERISKNEEGLLGQPCSEIQIKNFDIGILVPADMAMKVAVERNKIAMRSGGTSFGDTILN